jgi:hypothetical protein
MSHITLNAAKNPHGNDDTKLVEIPKLPFVGSMISSFSGILPMDESKTFETWSELRRRRFGDFYSIGIPGVGEGWYFTLYSLRHSGSKGNDEDSKEGGNLPHEHCSKAVAHP